jgi:uncharacterized protein (TIGR00288 family)
MASLAGRSDGDAEGFLPQNRHEPQIMGTFFSRGGAGDWAGTAVAAQRTSRSAALLIDFDNVTLGVHTDLGRELKSLINSEVFRGKIAVRRAYADWRRFPNYVVPLTEASIDLIFAPAYGSSKKNTTDLRMSADAIELAFTRPEIDTFILLTGDSDFSSTVMKLKEYGKYVIGVGMRESSSDLIIQNCDEYFSYHALTGLTKTSAGEGMREDPWELVVRAAQRMASTGDAMRTDRLKQVMLSLDPGFNEKEIGYSKFSKFVAEADKKGLVKLNKLPDGQYEISVDGSGTPQEVVAERREPRRDRDRSRDRGRGRRDGADSSRGDAPAETRRPAPEPLSLKEEPTPVPALQTPAPAERVVASTPAAAPAAKAATEGTAIERAVSLLQRAVRALGKGASGARDGDVKRRMLEMDESFDESGLGFSKFSRFLRQAHDMEAIDLVRVDSGQYEVRMGSRGYDVGGSVGEQAGTPGREARAEAPSAPAETQPEAASETRGRGRRGRGRGAAEGPPPLLPGQVVGSGAGAPAKATTPDAVTEPEKPAAEVSAPAPKAPKEDAPAAEAPKQPEAGKAAAAEPRPAGRRRGRRGGAGDGPPPPLPGQVIAVAGKQEEEPAAAASGEPQTDDAGEPAAPRKRRRGGRGSRGGDRAESEAVTPSGPPAFDAARLGLPTDRAEIAQYISRSYKGVGARTVEPLIDAFGEDVFRVLAEQPERVRELLGERRASLVIGQWSEDLSSRLESAPSEQPAADPEPAPVAEAEVAEEPATAEPAPRSRGRRGGRGRKPRSETDTAETASAPPEPAPEREPTPEAVATEDKPVRSSRRGSRGGRGRKPKTAEPGAKAESAPVEEVRAEASPDDSKPKRASRGGRATKASAPKAEGPAAAEPSAGAPAEPAAKPRARGTRSGRGRGTKKPPASEN